MSVQVMALRPRSVSNRRHVLSPQNDYGSTSNRPSRNLNNNRTHSLYSGHKRRQSQPDNDCKESPAKRRRIQFTNERGKWSDNKIGNMQRRKTRMQYRNLAEYTHNHRAQIADPITYDFVDNLEKQEVLWQDVGHVQEAYMDIQQSQHMASILKEQCRKLGNEQFTITPNEYIGAVQREFGEEKNNNDGVQSVDWSAIGDRFASWFLTIPSIRFMNGALQRTVIMSEAKKRQIRRKPSRFESDVPLIKPKQVVKQSKSDKTETKTRITNLTKTLKSKCEAQDGVNPFEFLINPESYSETVENIFDLSFIVKEGRGQMVVNDITKQPVLTYISRSERTRRYDHGDDVDNRQCIVKFNPATFCNLINIYNITDSQIRREKKPVNKESDTESEEEVESQRSVAVNKRNCIDRVRIRSNDKEEAD